MATITFTVTDVGDRDVNIETTFDESGLDLAKLHNATPAQKLALRIMEFINNVGHTNAAGIVNEFYDKDNKLLGTNASGNGMPDPKSQN